MQIYSPPVAEMKFLLEAFGYDKVQALEQFASYDLDMVEAILKQNGAFCSEVLLPLNRSGDQEGLKWDPKTGDVTTPKGFKDAYAKMVEHGFVTLEGPADHGGGGAPMGLTAFMSEMWTSTNKAFSMCSGLTHGLVEALDHYASDEIKEAYLPKLVTGEWAGTMCLTEPQCGTDLGMVRSKAVPDGDRYKITGTKIWITFGEHDFTENIIHLVLARLPDAPAGIKGISTFVVPKITLEGKRNNVKCTGLEHKMGIHASPTCVIDMEEAEGWLVGEPHKGMRAMFAMMNGARLLVGMEGVALGEIAYQTALAYAKDRRQSRALDPAKRDKDHPADNILVHPDVRRMLLNIKSTTEGMRALGAFVSTQIDLAHFHPDEKVKQDADDIVALLTPVVKSYFTERGFLNVSEAMQVCGGSGYTTDWSIEQYMRDVRIGMIYEGTNHIQALDLVGRKLARHGGRLLQAFAGHVTGVLEANAGNEQLAEFAKPTADALQQLMSLTMELGGKAMADPEEAGAGASNYLNLFGLTCLAFAWFVQVKHALETNHPNANTKVKTARYFYNMILPESDSLIRIIRAGKEHMMAFDAEEL